MTAFISQQAIKLGDTNKEQKNFLLMVMENPLGKPVVREISPENSTHIKPENV